MYACVVPVCGRPCESAGKICREKVGSDVRRAISTQRQMNAQPVITRWAPHKGAQHTASPHPRLEVYASAAPRYYPECSTGIAEGIEVKFHDHEAVELGRQAQFRRYATIQLDIDVVRA